MTPQQEQRLLTIAAIETSGLPPWNHHVSIAAEVHRTIDLDLLERSWQHVVSTHPALETGFDLGSMTQSIQRDRRELPSVIVIERDNATPLDVLLSRLIEMPFELATPPLGRLAYLPIDGGNTVILLVLDHLIADGTSASIVLAQMFTCYESLVKSWNVPALPSGDYGSWVRAVRMAGDSLARQGTAVHTPGSLSTREVCLPAMHPAPARPTNRSVDAFVSIPGRVRSQVEQTCRANRVTPFMLFVGAFAVMARCPANSVVELRSSVAGRESPEMEALVGWISNLVPLRITVDTGRSFVELLQVVREAALDAWEGRNVPFYSLLRLDRPTEYANPFARMWCLFDYIPDLEDETSTTLPTWVHPFPASGTSWGRCAGFWVIESGEGFEIEATVDGDRIDGAHLQEFLERLAECVEALSAASEQPIVRVLG